MNPAHPQNKIPAYLPWCVWGLGATFFFIEYFARIAPSVMVPELMRDFHVNAAALGAMSTFFYIAYVAMQVPVGMLMDHYGPHRLLTLMSVLCAVATALFAFTHSISVASFSRLLLGFASAFAFVGSLKLASLWFPSDRIGLLSGLTQALGMLGAALGTPMVASTVSTFGWRQSMAIIALLFVILAVFIWRLVQDKPGSEDEGSHENLEKEAKNVFRGLWQVLRNPQSWINGLYVGFLYAPTAVIGEMWGVSYFERTYAIPKQLSSFLIGAIFIGWAVGGPLFGFLSDYMGRRKPMLIFSALLGAGLMTVILFVPHLPVPLLFVLLFLYGMTNTGVATSYAVASEINAKALAGTSMAFANMASVLLGAALLPVVGWLLDFKWDGVMEEGVRVYSVSAYHMAFASIPLLFLVSFVAAFFIRETYCQGKDQ